MSTSASRRRSRRDASGPETTGERRQTGKRHPPGRDDADRDDRVKYDRNRGAQTPSDRYDIDVGTHEVRRLEQLESTFGSDQVRRWADEGIPVEAMGKPKDMQAARASRDGSADADTGTQTGPAVQTRLEVSSPNDPAEREAEAVAEQVTGPRGGSDREPGDGPDRERSQTASPAVSRGQSGGGAVSGEGESTVRQGVQGGGRSLPEQTRTTMESRMGADFSDVRVHTGSTADEAARSVGAEAYTLGSDIAFADGAYQPNSTGGRKLLAHELTHVVQQGADRGRSTPARRSTGEQVQRGLFEDAGSAVESAVESAAEDIEDAGEAAVESAGQAVSALSEKAGELGSQVWDALQRNGQALVNMLQQAGQQAWDLLKQGGQQAWNAIQNAGSQVWSVLQQGGQRLWNLLDHNTQLFLNMLQQGGQQAWSLFGNAGQRLWHVIQSAGSRVWPILRGAGQRLWSLLQHNTQLFLNMLQQGGQQAWQILKNGGRRLWQVIQSGGSPAQVWAVLQSTGQRLWSLLQRNTQLFLQMLRRGGQQAWQILANAGQQLWPVIQSAGSQVWAVLQSTGQHLWHLLQHNIPVLVNVIQNGPPQAWQILKNGGTQVWQVIQNGGKSVWNALQQNTRQLAALLTANTPLLANMLHNVGPRIWNVLASLGSQLWSVLRQAGQAVWQALQTAAQQFWGFLQTVPGGLWDFIRETGKKALLLLHTASELVFEAFLETPERLIRLLRDLSRVVVAIPMWLWEGIRTLLTDPSRMGEWFLNGILDAAAWVGRIITDLLDIVRVGEIYDLIALFLSRETRILTSEEQNEAQSVIGDTIDYPQIRIDVQSIITRLGTIGESAGVQLGVVTFHTINIARPINASAGNGDMAFLIHEITHVAQYEAVGSRYMPEAGHAQAEGAGYEYSYSDLESESFRFFNREQQASIIADYYALREGISSHEYEYTGAPGDFRSNFGGSNDYEDVYMSHVEACRSGRM